MIRAFTAIPLPEEVTDALEIVQDDLPAGRPVLPEDMHITLVFLGEVRNPDLDELNLAFEAVRPPPFDLSLTGLGQFGGAAPRVIYAAVGESSPLRRLQAKLQQAARNLGIEIPSRRYVPHVTIARLKGRREEADAVARFVTRRAALSLPPIAVDAFSLFSSRLTRDGPVYDVMARYDLVP